MARGIAFGTVIGELTVLERAISQPKHGYYWTVCTCGKIQEVRTDSLKGGKTKSCGRCDWHEKVPLEYAAWCNMHTRCYNQEYEYFHRYGGRGITVCKDWFRFPQFLIDMGTKPNSELTLERQNNDGHYEPTNCKWATWQEQANNRG